MSDSVSVCLCTQDEHAACISVHQMHGCEYVAKYRKVIKFERIYV